MTRAVKAVGIILCVLGAVLLAGFSIDSGESYWLYLMLAGLLGVAAGVIKNIPGPGRRP